MIRGVREATLGPVVVRQLTNPKCEYQVMVSCKLCPTWRVVTLRFSARGEAERHLAEAHPED